MKKFLILILIIGLVAFAFVFLPKKSTQNSISKPVLAKENTDVVKQELLISFRNFRESIYKLKQAEIIKSVEKKLSPKVIKPELCLKMAYDLQAFVMRARLTPNAIEKADCQKMNQYFWAMEENRKSPKVSKPSYTKRLGQDVSYFAQELNKQAWPNEDLIKKKKDFDLETKTNRAKLSKLPKSKKQAQSATPKCMKTILMHEKEFRKVCKIQK